MSKRKTHEEFIKELNDINKDITVLSKYVNNHDKISCQCNKCKYKWNVIPKSLLRGHKCPKCAGMAKKTHEEFLKEMSIIHPDIEVVGTYVDSKSNILCRCKIDKHEWYTTPNSLLRNRGCPKCAGNIKKTNQEFITEMRIKNPNIKIKGKYINTNTHILCECKIHNIEWNALPKNLLNGSKCPKCGIESTTLKNTISHDDFIKKLGKNAPNLLVLGEYRNRKFPIKVQCKKCNYSWESSPHSLLLCDNICPNCHKKLRRTIEDYKKDFYKINTNSIIIDTQMDDDFVNMKGKIKVKCKKDGYIWDVTSSYAIKHNIQCPLCRNFKTVTGINDLSTLHPELVQYFKYPERAKFVNSGGRTYEEMICPYCGNEKNITPRQLVVYGFGCQECSDGVSYPNKFCRAFLKQLPISNLIFEYNPDWIRPKKFDNYFEYNGEKYILEADGGFHFQFNTYTNESSYQAQLKDLEKENIAHQHGISVIRIDCRKSNLDYISNNILNSILSELFDLSTIDWDVCNKQATNSLIYEVCKNYNDKNCTLDKRTDVFYELAELYGVHYETIRRYLRRGAELGLCDFDNSTYIKRTSKKVLLFDNEYNFISEFLSPTQCAKFLNQKYTHSKYNISGICRACRTNNHRYKEFIIKYANVYIAE